MIMQRRKLCSLSRKPWPLCVACELEIEDLELVAPLAFACNGSVIACGLSTSAAGVPPTERKKNLYYQVQSYAGQSKEAKHHL